VNLKIFQKASCECTLDKLTNEIKRKDGKEICSGFQNNFLEVANIFKETSKNFKFTFLLNKAG
jgi:hypothetical protein